MVLRGCVTLRSDVDRDGPIDDCILEGEGAVFARDILPERLASR
jgi:hypothetical protein